VNGKATCTGERAILHKALFEERVASLESAEAGLAVASGMAAISSTLWTLLQAGDQVVIDHTLYGNSFVLFVRGLPRFGVKVVVADFTDLDAVETAIGLGAPKLVFFESPANPNLRVITLPPSVGSRTRPEPRRSSTTPSPRPHCSSTSSSAPTSSCIQRPSSLAGMAILSSASWRDQKASSKRSRAMSCATSRAPLLRR